MEQISLLEPEMLLPNGTMRSGITVVNFPISKVILDQLSYWDLDTKTLNRQNHEDSLPLTKSYC